MKETVIKPKKNKKEVEHVSLLTPIIYLIIGIILAFKNNEAVTILFYIIGILVIVYGIKGLIDYYNNKELVQYKNINISVSVVSIIIGVLLIVLGKALEVSIRYVLGFFLIFLGVSRILTQISYHEYKNLSFLVNIVLIILGIFSVFVSNIILVIAGWLMIFNAGVMFYEYFNK